MESKVNDSNEIKKERIRVRKRIRVKKKSDPKTKVKKVLKLMLWWAVVLAFIATLIIMVREADIRDKDKSFDINPTHPFPFKMIN